MDVFQLFSDIFNSGRSFIDVLHDADLQLVQYVAAQFGLTIPSYIITIATFAFLAVLVGGVIWFIKNHFKHFMLISAGIVALVFLSPFIPFLPK